MRKYYARHRLSNTAQAYFLSFDNISIVHKYHKLNICVFCLLGKRFKKKLEVGVREVT